MGKAITKAESLPCTKKAGKKKKSSPKKKGSPKKAKKAKKGAKKGKKKKKKKAKKKKKKRKKAKKKKKLTRAQSKHVKISAKKKAASRKNALKLKAKGKGIFAPKSLSKELAAVCGGNRMARTEVTKRIWKYIKAHKANAGRTIKPDAALAKVFGGGAFNMFKMPGMLSKHIK